MRYFLILSLLSGCVSIHTTERIKHDEFVKGRINGMQTSLNILKESDDKKDAIENLKSLLGCSGEWK